MLHFFLKIVFPYEHVFNAFFLMFLIEKLFFSIIMAKRKQKVQSSLSQSRKDKHSMYHLRELPREVKTIQA